MLDTWKFKLYGSSHDKKSIYFATVFQLPMKKRNHQFQYESAYDYSKKYGITFAFSPKMLSVEMRNFTFVTAENDA